MRKIVRRVVVMMCLIFLFALAAFLLIIVHGPGYYGLTVQDVMSHTWVPNDCDGESTFFEQCVGEGELNYPACFLKSDGYIYNEGRPFAKFSSGFIPFVSESAPRTGARAKFTDLETGAVCTLHSTSKLSLFGF